MAVIRASVYDSYGFCIKRNNGASFYDDYTQRFKLFFEY